MDIQTLKQTLNDNLSRYGSFQETFWRFIKTEVGITHIYQEKQSYLKKKITFEERKERVNTILQRADFDDDKLNPSDQELTKWSDEALELSQNIRMLGLNKDICTEEFLFKFFQTFYAQKSGIQTMDEQLVCFENLKILNLSNNRVKRIQNLPPQLRELNLTGNLVEEIEMRNEPLTSLIHLGVANNRINSRVLAQICDTFPNLFCLDLASNQLVEFETSLEHLEKLKSIKMLYLKGNPLVLTAHYREIIKQHLQDLVIIDGTKAFSEVEENAKKKHRKRVQAKFAHLGEVPAEAFKVPAAERIPIEPFVRMELEFRLLDNINGVYINQENCSTLETLNLDEVPVEMKSSQYWLTYKDLRGETISSEKKAWIDHFQVDPESGKGKCDLDFKMHVNEQISVELRDWLFSDIFAELHCSQPKIVNRISEDGETSRDISMDEQGNPEVEHSVIGVMRLETSRLILITEL